MGNRGDIIIMPPGARPYHGELEKNPQATLLHTHWGGSDMTTTLHEAIQDLGLKKAMDPEALTQKLLSLDFELTDILMGSYLPIMVSPSEGMIYFGWGYKDSPWLAWSYDEFLNLSKKNLGMLQDAHFAMEAEAGQKYVQRRMYEDKAWEARDRLASRDRMTTWAVSSIPLGIAGVLGLTSYFKSRNQ